MDIFKISKRIFCDFLTGDASRTLDQLMQHLKTVCDVREDHFKCIKDKIGGHFMPHFLKKWKNVFYDKEKFYLRFDSWINADFVVELETDKKNGRPFSVEFEEGSTSTKRRKLITIEENYSETEIQEAFLHMLRRSGRKNVANDIKKLLSLPVTDVENDTSITPFTAVEALALFEEAKLTKAQYHLIHIQARNRNADIFPPYKNLSEVKKQCCPDKMIITEKGVKFPTQSIIDHTVTQLLEDPSINLPDMNRKRACPLTIHVK